MKTEIKIAFGFGEDFISACKSLENMMDNISRAMTREGYDVTPDPTTTHVLRIRDVLPYHYLTCKIIGVKNA